MTIAQQKFYELLKKYPQPWRYESDIETIFDANGVDMYTECNFTEALAESVNLINKLETQRGQLSTELCAIYNIYDGMVGNMADVGEPPTIISAFRKWQEKVGEERDCIKEKNRLYRELGDLLDSYSSDDEATVSFISGNQVCTLKKKKSEWLVRVEWSKLVGSV